MDASRNPAPRSTPWDLVLVRAYDRPSRLVFRAWTEPTQMAQWWGPRGFTNPVCELDPRPGGELRIHMRGPDGTVFPTVGVYREIVEPERLVFTASALDGTGRPLFEVLNTVTFSERDGATRVAVQAQVLKWIPAGERFLDGMEAGWGQTLERLATHVAKS